VSDRREAYLLLSKFFPVEFLMDVTQALVGDVRVDLRRRHTAMAEEFLNASKIGTT
jgi:hypothetical protein